MSSISAESVWNLNTFFMWSTLTVNTAVASAVTAGMAAESNPPDVVIVTDDSKASRTNSGIF